MSFIYVSIQWVMRQGSSMTRRQKSHIFCLACPHFSLVTEETRKYGCLTASKLAKKTLREKTLPSLSLPHPHSLSIYLYLSISHTVKQTHLKRQGTVGNFRHVYPLANALYKSYITHSNNCRKRKIYVFSLLQ